MGCAPGRIIKVRPLDLAMDYQLVLQFRGDSLGDLDATVALEDELIEELGDAADVDGHDVGSGETNIFIFTFDPAAAFHRARSVPERREQLQAVTADRRGLTKCCGKPMCPAVRLLIGVTALWLRARARYQRAAELGR